MNQTTRITAIAVALAVIALGACKNNDNQDTAAAQQESTQSDSNRIEIPPIVRSNLGITFANVERRRVDSTVRVPGVFELQPLARREYRMTLPGEIDLAVDQYERVEPGDLLYRFRSPEWPELQHEIIVGEQGIESAQATIEVAQARITETEQHLSIMRDRLSALADAEIRNAEIESQLAEIEASLPRLRAELRQSQRTLENAHRTREHALHRASAATGIDESQLSKLIELNGSEVPAYQTIDWIEVRATQTGVVEMLAQTDGSFAAAPSLVLSTVDMSMIRFRALAMQADLARFGDASIARIVPPRVRGIKHDDSINATVTIGLEADPAQRTVSMIAISDETRAWMRPGVSAYLEIVVDSTSGPALAIPRAAIVKDGIVHVFFRRDPQDPSKAIRVEADMGVDDGYWVAINSGLSLKDEVVLDGAYELKLASEQSGASQKGGHFHADGSYHEEQ
jgi:multidrug efflux pump subunit AcrA (membrane-fusion protein)